MVSRSDDQMFISRNTYFASYTEVNGVYGGVRSYIDHLVNTVPSKPIKKRLS